MGMSVNVRVEFSPGPFLGAVESKTESGVNAAAQVVVRKAKELAPKDTGALAASITYTIVRQSGMVSALISAQTPYARRRELGFVGTDSLGRFYSDPPMPYMRPALFGQRGALVSAVARG
jgi:hypothetical protein